MCNKYLSHVCDDKFTVEFNLYKDKKAKFGNFKWFSSHRHIGLRHIMFI